MLNTILLVKFNKLKRGICFNEFFEKNSCRNGINCQYCHEIPDSVRTDSGMMKAVDDKIKNSYEKRKKSNSRPEHLNPRPEPTGYHGIRTTSQPNTRDQLTTANNYTIQQERSAIIPTAHQQAENNLQPIRPSEVAPHPTANNSQQPAVGPQIISQQNVQVTPQLAANQSQPPAYKSQSFSQQSVQQNTPWQQYENFSPVTNETSNTFLSLPPKADFLNQVSHPFYIPWAPQMQQLHLPSQRNL